MEKGTGNASKVNELLYFAVMCCCLGYVLMDVVLLSAAHKAPPPVLVLFGLTGVAAQTMWLNERKKAGRGAGAALPGWLPVLSVVVVFAAVLFVR